MDVQAYHATHKETKAKLALGTIHEIGCEFCEELRSMKARSKAYNPFLRVPFNRMTWVIWSLTKQELGKNSK